MDISTNMEIGYILITLIGLLLIGGIASMSCSLAFHPNTIANSVYTPKKKLIETKRTEVKEPDVSNHFSNYFDDDEPAELEIDGDLFDD